MMPYLLLALCYGIGAIPSGLLVSRFYGIDITTRGSGNVGATNIARSVGKVPGIITLIADVTKGVAACYVAGVAPFGFLFLEVAAIGGLLAVMGHCFSVPGILKGGKGVATGLGVLGFLSLPSALCALGVFALTFFISRIVSLSSLGACLGGFLWYELVLRGSPNVAILILIMCLLISYRHRENIERLAAGTEAPFTSKR